MNRRLLIGYRLHRISRVIQRVPFIGHPLAHRIRKTEICRDYVMWSWSDY